MAVDIMCVTIVVTITGRTAVITITHGTTTTTITGHDYECDDNGTSNTQLHHCAIIERAQWSTIVMSDSLY